MRTLLLGVAASIFVINGCSMFTAWKSIPPPGGCDQCHTTPITANWQAMYKAPSIPDERGRLSFQTSEYNQPAIGGQDSPLETKKVQEKACFDCHKSPTPAHKKRAGRFHH
ncbi:MAG: cytochrome C [Desulfuromonadaceae bacterium]|nr:cytochrome C [Desulfuromonadaceae bacterium]MDD2854055.1 cytochrome C [Desulfuromonadaceae bacterium]